jgi:hypothetical protein
MLVEQMQTRGYVAESQSTERGMALPSEESLERLDIESSDAVLKGGADG